MTPGSEAVSHNTVNDIVLVSVTIATSPVFVMAGCNWTKAFFMFRLSIPSAAIWFQS